MFPCVIPDMCSYRQNTRVLGDLCSIRLGESSSFAWYSATNSPIHQCIWRWTMGVKYPITSLRFRPVPHTIFCLVGSNMMVLYPGLALLEELVLLKKLLSLRSCRCLEKRYRFLRHKIATFPFFCRCYESCRFDADHSVNGSLSKAGSMNWVPAVEDKRGYPTVLLASTWPDKPLQNHLRAGPSFTTYQQLIACPVIPCNTENAHTINPCPIKFYCA